MIDFSKRIVRPMRIALALAGALLALPQPQARASSHSDAPLIKQDPAANLTDVYAFVGTKYDGSGTPVLNVVVNVHPFCEPGDGVIYDRFADDALYSINITDPKTGTILCTYDFQFSPVSSAAGNYKNLDTILSYGRGTAIGPINTIGEATQNYTQTYTVIKMMNGRPTVLGTNLPVPPPNVGNRVTPDYNDVNGNPVSGATTYAGLDSLTAQAVQSLSGGVVSFAGLRDDSFFADTPGIFDLLNPRILGPDGHGQTGNGVDGFKGYNVLNYSLQIPLSSLPQRAYNDAFTGASHGIGVFASVSRQRITLRSGSGDPVASGPYIQVNRLGNPLFNEVLVALRDKDNYNRDVPTNDATRYAQYATNPEVAVLLNAVFGLNTVTTGRADLAAVYIPDVLRVDTTTGPVPLIGQTGNRLSGIGGDTTNGKWSGWPNGRRLGDDVVDIALTAVASGPTYSSIFLVGDNINANDEPYNYVFPYAATPHSGTHNFKDSVNNTP
jgi:hypothetical protein